MKKLLSGKKKEILPLTLYKEDLEELYQIIYEKCENVTISDDVYEYENMAELLTYHKGRDIKELALKGWRPYINLYIGDLSYLSVSEDTESSIYLYTRCAEILEKRKRWFAFLLNKYFGYIACFIAGESFSDSFSSYLSLKIFGLFCALYALLSLFLYNHGILYRIATVSVHERQNFFTRNKDEILKWLLFTALTALVFFAEKYIKLD